MSDAVGPDASAEAPAQAEQAPATTGDQPADTSTINPSSQEADTKSKPMENGDKLAQAPIGPDPTLEGDSEAETLIESPEKKRNLLENPPHLQSTIASGPSESPTKAEPNGADDRMRTRKRKRAEAEQQDKKPSPASSRRSSPLSSPVANEASNSDSDVSVRRSARKVEATRMRKRDRDSSKELDETNTPAPGPVKVRKRRPSDLLPITNKHRTKQHSSSIDNGSLVERRETRSATYPRHSSEERSASPEPIARREHRRGASTQISSLSVEKKRRAQPPPINTRRNRSIDARSDTSDSSQSPPPSRPRLHKFASHENDPSSPAKTMSGPRKNRDKNGRTQLARAASSNNYEAAKQRLLEQPGEINADDNACNTPLQIASLEGFVDIVKLLLAQKNCDINPRNIDKDTPLIDAVENGHVEVVRLLLEAGADSRMANAKGQEPVELIEDKQDRDSREIKRLLNDAKKRDPKRRLSDDQFGDGSSRAASAASPRDSPPIQGPRSPPIPSSRRRTGRSESTRTGLLWEASTPDNMTKLAEKGDTPGVVNILEILGRVPAEAMIAAAKGGHETMFQMMQAIGRPDADPDPMKGSNLKPGHNTPMLAAIGRGNLNVVKLILDYRNHGDDTGFNPTRKYQGKTYYEISQERKGHDWQNESSILKAAYDKYSESKGRKQTSPKKARELDKGKSRSSHDSSSPVAIKQRSQTESPAMSHKSLPESKSGLHRESRRDNSGSSEKTRAHAATANGEKSAAIASDPHTSSAINKTSKSRRSNSDLPPFLGLEGGSQKRRRLVTGKEHRQGNGAAADTVSEAEMTPVQDLKLERPERPGLKRSRSSLSPERTKEGATSESPKTMSKKRRTLQDNDSRDDARSAASKKSAPGVSSHDSVQTIEVRTASNAKKQEKEKQAKMLTDVDEVFKRHRRKRSTQSNASIVAEDVDTMEDVQATKMDTESTTEAQKPTGTETQSSKADEQSSPDNAVQSAAEAQLQDEQAKAAVAKAEEDEAKKAEEARMAEQQRLIDAEAAEQKRKAEEVEARKRAEEEAMVRRKEEEERRAEQIRREIEEQRRQQEEQRRLEFLENERRRQAALPDYLGATARLLDEGDPLVRSYQWLYRFRTLLCVWTKQLDPDCDPDELYEPWITNFQAACLLATKDLKLTQYTSLERRPVTQHQREAIWRVFRGKISVGHITTPFSESIQAQGEREDANRPKLMAMEDLFWVKVRPILASFCACMLTSLPSIPTLRIRSSATRIWRL